MCGIGGQVKFDNSSVSQKILKQIGDSLEHRGRDHVGYYVNKNVGLVHRRLSIIDISSAGNQPMFTLDGKIGIVFNGEIFNYLELRREIEKKGYFCNTNSDTEVLLKSYQAYGLDFLNKIEGMFAFCLLDLEKQCLYLVRDRLGIKPMYYHKDSFAITFASEIKGIIKSGVTPPIIDPIGLCDYVHIQLYTHDHTLFRDIRCLEPGNYLDINLQNHSILKRKYWDMPEEDTNLNYNDAIECLRGLITDAVRLWSRSDVPIAAYISGGLDSSTVATIAQSCLNTNVQTNLITFSSIFPEANFQDERPYSDAVVAKIQSKHHRVILPKDKIIKAHHDLLYVLDMPIAGYSAPYRVLSEIVRKKTKVVLTGHGGDELFCGYPKYIAANFAKQISESLSGNKSSIDTGNIKYLKGFEKQARQILSRSIVGQDDDIIKSLFFRSSHLWQYVHPSIRSLADGYSVTESLKKIYSHRNSNYLKNLLYLDIKVLLPGLLHVEDRTSMIENLESRTPLLDRKVVEFAGSVPEQYLLKDGLKGLIRKAVEPLLPNMVTQNPSKSGTMYPASELFDRELKELVDSDLSILDRSGLFIKPVKDILEESHELVNKRVIWALWSLGAWIRTFKPIL